MIVDIRVDISDSGYQLRTSVCWTSMADISVMDINGGHQCDDIMMVNISEATGPKQLSKTPTEPCSGFRYSETLEPKVYNRN